MKYFDKKILFVCTLNSSLGDTVLNAYTWVGKLKNLHPRSIVHGLLNCQSYTNAGHILVRKGLFDYIYPANLMGTTIETMDSFLLRTLKLTKYDIVLFSPWDKIETHDSLKTMFPDAIFLWTNRVESFGTTEDIIDYQTRVGGFNVHHFNGNVLPSLYHQNLNRIFVNDCLEIARNKSYEKTVCLFGASSRALANVSYVGMQKVVEICNKNGFFCFVCGTHSYNVYTPTSNGVDWKVVYERDYGDGSCNVDGTGWEKTISLMEATTATITGPTGAVMIPPLFGVKLIWLSGGDSRIMEGCLHSFTNRENMNRIPCSCPFHPCGPNTVSHNEEKAKKCAELRMPLCLNDELNTEELDKVLKTI